MLKTKNICAGYGKKEILKDINIAVEDGSFTAIIGRNGAGKSTLLKVLCGLLKPSKGEVFIDGTNINEFSNKVLAKKLAFMPQTVDTSFPFTVKEFIMLGRYPYMNILKIPAKQDFESVKAAIDFMQMGDFADRKINELSGGERQKVLIAQNIAQDADILIFDEPTAHLDIGAQYAILDFLKDLNEKSGKSIIMTLHDLNAAGEFCENIILMDEGRIKNFGSPQKVLNFQDIEEAYKTTVIVKTNPISGKPFVIPVKGNKENNYK